MTLLLTVVLITLSISATCSFLESVLYSARTTTLQTAVEKGTYAGLARKFLEMKEHVARPIAAILILNTVANTAGATIAGMYAARSLGPEYVPLFSAGLTAAILIFSEIVPKTVGASRWQLFWPLAVWPLQIMQIILAPLVWLSHRLTRLFTRSEVPGITEDEILALVKLGASAGEISQEESRMVRNIIGLDRIPVKKIMTPRNVMFSLPLDVTVEEALTEFAQHGFSRAPLYKEDREHIVGYALLQDLLHPVVLGDQKQRVGEFQKRISFFPETANCLTILTDFILKRKQIAIVSDEYGGVSGLVTLEDLMETVLGKEIVDERDKIDDLQKIARQKRPEGSL